MKIKMLPRAPLLQHGRDWEGDDPSGWFVTEKLDGVRCYWDGERAWSKDGNEIKLPPHILKHMPEGVPLDGEIHHGAVWGTFEDARRAVQYGQWNEFIKFTTFDRPDMPGHWLQRTMNFPRTWPMLVPGHVCTSYAQLMDNLRKVQSRGGEGLMIYSPLQTCYERKRTSRLLKVKLVLPLLS